MMPNCPTSRQRRPAANANVASIRLRFGSILLVAALVLPVSACARPLGDLGRAAAEPTLFADVLGKSSSSFNQTDEEREMHDRVWRYLTAPHVSGWFSGAGFASGQTQPEVDAYYHWLTSERFQSSPVRYANVSSAVLADLGTMPDTFRSICAVFEIDRQRAVAASEISGLEPKMQQQVLDRKADNTEFIDRFTSSVRYRYDAYSYALDHLLVETPHHDAVRLDSLLSDLAIYAGAAEARDFCSDHRIGKDRADSGEVRGRMLHTPPSEGTIPK